METSLFGIPAIRHARPILDTRQVWHHERQIINNRCLSLGKAALSALEPNDIYLSYTTTAGEKQASPTVAQEKFPIGILIVLYQY